MADGTIVEERRCATDELGSYLSPYTWPFNANITPVIDFTVNHAAPSAASLPVRMLVDWIRFTPG
jgi:hypothetical protein